MAALSGTPVKSPECIFIPNASAQKVSDPQQIRELLARQLMSPVRWIETMQRAKDENLNFFLEIGPGKVLKGLARKCQPEFQVEPCGTAADIQKIETVLVQI